MPGRFEAEFRFGAERQRSDRRREDGPTLRIVVLADLGGRAGRVAQDPRPPIAQRSLLAVDVDNFGEVLARIAPRLEIHLGGPDSPGLPIVFRSLDDFHPDALYRGLEPFGPVRDIRRRLLDASTFSKAAAEWSRLAGLAGDALPAASGAAPSLREDDVATRQRLLGRGSAAMSRVPPAMASARAELDHLLREVVAPHIVPSADRRLPELLRSVDDTAAALLRAILHHPDFQALEAAWRSVHGLVTEIETDTGVALRLLDVTRAELQTDSATGGVMALERLLTDHEAAEDASSVWPLIVAAFTFGPDDADVILLERIGAIAGRTGGPVLAAADPALVGCRSFAETPDPLDWNTLGADSAQRWSRLRESAAASWIGLAMPRILLRLPYGKRGDPVESFDFEELPSGPDHEAYLWGNPAFACARLIASSFVEHGAAMEPGNHLELDDLPAAVYDDGEGPKMKPCAETALSEAAAQRILDAGAMPLLASTRRNAVRVLRMQSIAHPPRALAGKWGHPSPPF
jgi:type VI secretion system protein ImpC